MAAAHKLIIGLGNPGTEYERTYHNVGALALDALATLLSDNSAPQWKIHKKLFSYLQTGDRIFVKPLTFMNESGKSVREAIRKFGVLPEDIILLQDDSDLPLGTFKISRGHGAAGHHGVESVIAALGKNDFTRVRIGIRLKHETIRKKAEEFILKPITKYAADVLRQTFLSVAEGLKEKSFI